MVPTLRGLGETEVMVGVDELLELLLPPELELLLPPELALVTVTVSVLPQLVPGFFTQNVVDAAGA